MPLEILMSYPNPRVIFLHSAHDGVGLQPVLVEICELKNLTNFEKWKHNKKWREIMEHRDRIYVDILYVIPQNMDKNGIDAMMRIYIDQYRPASNAYETIVPNGRMIRCVDLDKIYKTSREACLDLGINPSHLSNHLNRLPGYNSVGGHTFERVY